MSPLTWTRLGLWSYLICAVFFVWGSVLSGDWISIAGSSAFFLGAAFFLLGHYGEKRDD